jgi:hypothetical protein
MKKFLLQILISFFFFYSVSTHSQPGFSHEFGVFFGVASLQTDFGESGDFASANQSSMTFGLTHYLKFFGNQYNWRSGGSYFGDHFKLKTDFSYINNTNIKHEAYLNRPGYEKLTAMTSDVKLYDIGINLEYYFIRLEDYASFYGSENSLNGFVSLGLHWSYFDPDVKVSGVSLPANSDPYLSLIDKWQNNSIYVDPNNTFGASIGAGLRYSLLSIDFVLDGRYQYFFSDEIEGLNAINDPANKNNDTMIFISFGIVYVFNKY